LPNAAWPQSADEFYRSRKELNLITSSSAGGGYDSYSRLVARHMTKYLPGNPTIVVQNMVGGGGIRAANYIYNVAPKDGSVYCLIDRGMPTAPLLYGDRSQARFDAEKIFVDRKHHARDRDGGHLHALHGQDYRGRQEARDFLRRDRAPRPTRRCSFGS